MNFEVNGKHTDGSVPVTGWRDTAEGAGDLAAHYLRAGWDSVTVTNITQLHPASR